MTAVLAGQKPAAKFFVILCVILLVIVGACGAGIRGSANTLLLIRADIEMATKVEAFVATFTEVTWLITALFADLRKSLIPVAVGLGIILILAILNPIARFDWTIMIVSVLAGVVLTAFSFIAFRLSLAIAHLVLKSSLLLYGLLLLTVVVAGMGMSLAIATTEDAYQVPLSQVIVAVLMGTFWSLMCAVAAFLSNRWQGVPWRYPHVFRTLALMIASWRGTSFHNLDLSQVNFQNAQLANTDLRARNFYRTCFQNASGLERARVDSRYLDLEMPKVQTLLIRASSSEIDYNTLNLRGAYLQTADLRRMSFIDTDLSGADLNAADLRGAILARTQLIGADFSHANLTGACIKDWSVNNETLFSNVLCDYVYRELDDKGEPTDRYPADRNFEPQEFESLYQEIGNVAELIFKEGVNWRAFSFSMQKLEVEDDGLGLELKGFERRGDRWVVRVTHNQHVRKQEVERRLTDMYEEMKGLLATKEEQINKLLGIASDQAEALKEISQKPLGNSFFIVGSTITNLTGSGNIEYVEAAAQVREIVTHGSDRKQVAPIIKQFVQQMKQQDVAPTGSQQLELIQQLLVAEAESDPDFRAYLLQQGQPILQAMAGTPLVPVIQGAIGQLTAQT